MAISIIAQRDLCFARARLGKWLFRDRRTGAENTDPSTRLISREPWFSPANPARSVPLSWFLHLPEPADFPDKEACGDRGGDQIGQGIGHPDTVQTEERREKEDKGD